MGQRHTNYFTLIFTHALSCIALVFAGFPCICNLPRNPRAYWYFGEYWLLLHGAVVKMPRAPSPPDR